MYNLKVLIQSQIRKINILSIHVVFSKVQMDSFHLSINLFSVFEVWDKETKTPLVVPLYS